MNEPITCGDAGRDEAGRLAALERYGVLDTPAEEAFDRITRLAQSALNVPIVLVSLIDARRQWFKSRQGMDARETPREISFCTHAIEQAGPYVINHADQHPLFANNPLVLNAPFIRFYAGIPLITPLGHKIGTLCAIDTEPREFSASQMSLLEDLARLVVDELELRRIAHTDSLTGALTQRSFRTDLDKEIERSQRLKSNLGLLMVDLDHFKSVNDTYGHATGDAVLRAFAQTCRQQMRQSDLFGRVGGEEFAIVLPDCGMDDAREFAQRLRCRIQAEAVIYGAHSVSFTMSAGLVLHDGCETAATLMERGDLAMYAAKAAGRNCVMTIEPGETLPDTRYA
jgi:diguanylate cyclase (GGDEF)-like protein